jgi:hypothetical protein
MHENREISRTSWSNDQDRSVKKMAITMDGEKSPLHSLTGRVTQAGLERNPTVSTDPPTNSTPDTK